MSYNWKNDGNLSQKSDMDYVLEVIDSLTAALHQDPNDTEKLFLRGNGYLDARRLDEALEDYSKIIGFGQVEAPVYNNRGICHRGMGNPKQAIVDFTKALDIDPLYRDAYNNRGMAKADLGLHEEALSDYNEAIDLDPEYWYAFNNRAMLLWALGDRKNAALDYEKVRKILGE